MPDEQAAAGGVESGTQPKLAVEVAVAVVPPQERRDDPREGGRGGAHDHPIGLWGGRGESERATGLGGGVRAEFFDQGVHHPRFEQPRVCRVGGPPPRLARPPRCPLRPAVEAHQPSRSRLGVAVDESPDPTGGRRRVLAPVDVEDGGPGGVAGDESRAYVTARNWYCFVRSLACSSGSWRCISQEGSWR